MQPPPITAIPIPAEATPDDLLALLAEWYDWWWNDASSPAKMPDALHIRTALVLHEKGIAPHDQPG